MRLDRKGLFKRGGAAVLLGALLHPAAALLALVEVEGDKEPGACAAALREYREIAADQTASSERRPARSKPGTPGR